MARTMVYRAMSGSWDRGGSMQIALQVGYVGGDGDFVPVFTQSVTLPPEMAAVVFTGTPDATKMRILDMTAAVSAVLNTMGIVDGDLLP